jgi:hypothetical protein
MPDLVGCHTFVAHVTAAIDGPSESGVPAARGEEAFAAGTIWVCERVVGSCLQGQQMSGSVVVGV